VEFCAALPLIAGHGGFSCSSAGMDVVGGVDL